MTRRVITIARSASLRNAWDLMERFRIRHLPVIEGGKISGILSDRDLYRAFPSITLIEDIGLLQKALDGIRVEKMMSRKLVVVEPHATLAHVAGVMNRRKLGCLPVVEKRVVLGIITSTDVLRWVQEGALATGLDGRGDAEAPLLPAN